MQLFTRAQPKPLTTVTRAASAAVGAAERARGCAPATVKRRAATRTTFFTFLAAELAAPPRPNPVSMRRHAGRQPHLRPRDRTDQEVATLRAVVDAMRDRAMVGLMRYAGLRVGAVAALQLADLTVPDDPQAPIRRRVLGKGRKERVVQLVRPGYQPLHDDRQASPPATPPAPLFRRRLGGAMTVAGIAERVCQAAQRGGVAVTCHRLRPTYGRWMADGALPVLALSGVLGHARIQTTRRSSDGADPLVRRSYAAALAQQPLVVPPPAPTSQG